MKGLVKKSRVVIVGGSFAGLKSLRNLAEKSHVTLIEPREYFEYTPGILPLLCGEGGEDILITPLNRCVKNARVVNGYFQGLNAEEKRCIVKDVDGSISEIEYDYLILAVGRPYATPIRPSSQALSIPLRVRELKELRVRVQGSKNIVVRGGGLVGVELAAELACRVEPRPRIKLISRSALLSGLPHAAGGHARRWFARNGVDVSESATDKTEINAWCRDADLVLDCTGRATIAASFQSKTDPGQQLAHLPTTPKSGNDDDNDCDGSSGSSSSSSARYGGGDPSLPPGFSSPFDKEGFIPVNEHLQWTHHRDVFAVGDVVRHVGSPVGTAMTTPRLAFGVREELPSLRNANVAESQAHAISRFIACATPTSPTDSGSDCGIGVTNGYPASAFGSDLTPALACVSLGPRHGILVFNNMVLGGVLFAMLAAATKRFIERSKISEVRGEAVGAIVWRVLHMAVNLTHACYMRIHRVLVVLRSFPLQRVVSLRQLQRPRSVKMST